MRLEANRTESAIELTIAQEHGPAQRFTLVWSQRSPALRKSRFLSGGIKAAGGLTFFTAASMIGAMSPGEDESLSALTPWVGLPVIVLCLVIGAALVRAYFWEGTTARFQECSHCQGMPETIAAAGDPRGASWAIEALDALRDGSFCRDSPKLHIMMKRPITDLQAEHSPNREVADLVLDAAIALREHGRLDDAGDVLLFVDAVPALSVLDGETARQAAQTIVDAYRLLDDVPADQRALAPEGFTSTPAQDATAAVDAALRGIDEIVETSANDHVQALQALRIYSKRWDPPSGAGE